MAQRVRIPHRGQSPSSVTQLPILTALHARSPTLFFLIIHETRENVNPLFPFFVYYQNRRNRQSWPTVSKRAARALKFVYFDEKTLVLQGNPLAFCALLLYNNANLLERGTGCGRIDRNRIRQGRHR